jgi:hypothetical protein
MSERARIDSRPSGASLRSNFTNSLVVQQPSMNHIGGSGVRAANRVRPPGRMVGSQAAKMRHERIVANIAKLQFCSEGCAMIV